MILTIKTDDKNPKISLIEKNKVIDETTWSADRELSDTLIKKIMELLQSNGQEMENLRGVVVYKGPGSFTSLRIGHTVANAISYGLEIPVVATNSADWQTEGIDLIANGEATKYVSPEYGSDANITKPKK